MTYEQTREIFLRILNENAGRHLFSSADLKNAIDAIEKQIPKKVDTKITSKVKALDVEECEIYTYSIVRCPSCSSPMTLHKGRKFCEKCGQALDWSDIDV